MRVFLAMTFAASLLAIALPAAAADPPYLPLAKVLGTPVLGASYGPPDKSRLLLKFIPAGQSMGSWKKLTTISILKVPPRDTVVATRGVIARLEAQLKVRHAAVRVFDRSPVPPISCYFEFTAAGETEKGVVYSPDPGFVTVAQVGAKNGGSISATDVKNLKRVIGR